MLMEATRSRAMTEPQTTSLTVFRTANGQQWRCTCVFKHAPALVFRDDEAWVAGHACALHVEVEHGWHVLSIADENGQILRSPAPVPQKP
jgi:hypothetical protein